MSKFAKPSLIGVVFSVAIIGVLLTYISFAAVPSSLIARNKQIVQEATNLAVYQDGMWFPSKYTSTQWGKYQHGAVAMAALSLQPDGTANQRQIAIDTVNKAIDTHQLPSGEFDNGTSAGNGGVDAGFWVYAQGLIALALKDDVPMPTLQKWEQSMVKYTQYLKSSGNSAWYANGNVVLMQTAAMLQTYKLATIVNDPNAQTYWQDYLNERTFLVNPVSPTDLRNPPAWHDYGQYSDGLGGFWFSESTSSGRSIGIFCLNGMVPCNGYDPNYITAQIQDAMVTYATGEDSQFWLNVINGEYAAIKPLVSNGNINASNGSRKNIPSETFFASPYYILEQNNLGNYDQVWTEQLNALEAEFAKYANGRDTGPNSYSLMLTASIPLIINSMGVTAPTTNIRSDLNRDGSVNQSDLNKLSASYRKTDATTDIDAISPVNAYDLNLLLTNYHK